MAKLKARGRVQVFRVAKALPDDNYATDRVERFALMSDRVVLWSLSVRMRTTTGVTEPIHKYGWKRQAVIKQGQARRLFDNLINTGYVQEGIADFGLLPGEDV